MFELFTIPGVEYFYSTVFERLEVVPCACCVSLCPCVVFGMCDLFILVLAMPLRDDSITIVLAECPPCVILGVAQEHLRRLIPKIHQEYIGMCSAGVRYVVLSTQPSHRMLANDVMRVM